MSNTVIDSIREKLSRILTYKNQIKTEAIAKGAEIDDTTTLREYPEKIAGISVSSNTETYYLTTTSTDATYLSSSYVNYDPRCFRVILDPSITSIFMNTFFASNYASTAVDASRQGSYVSPMIGALMGYIEGQNVSHIGSSAFRSCYNLRNISFPKLQSMSENVFWQCSKLQSASFPLLKSLGSACFSYCSSLETAYMPLLSIVPIYCFAGCVNLSSFDFTNLTSVLDSGFCSCKKMSGILSTSKLTSIGSSAFFSTALTEVNLPNTSYIGSNAFMACKQMSRLSLPNYTGIISFIYGCNNLTTGWFPKCTGLKSMYGVGLSEIYTPACTSIESNTFWDASALQRAHFGSVGFISSRTFAGCTALSYLRFNGLNTIYASTSSSVNAFYNCFNLISLYLLGSGVCSLQYSYAFSSTPIAGYSASTGCYGSIFVRASLVDSYKSATNWTYFSSRFVGLTDEEIEALPY